MANPVLSDKRFAATAEDLEPGWAAPARTATATETGGAGAPPPAPTAAFAPMSANGTFIKTFFLWGLIVVSVSFALGWIIP
jgi:hypothetical protein